jgi:hypothetical protein
MNWFNPDAFDFGLIIFGCISFQNLLVIFLCARFGVGIEKYALLIDPWGKCFYSRKVSNVKVAVGVLPFGGYVKPCNDSLDESGQQFSLNSKSTWQRIVIRYAGVIGWLFLLLVGLFFLQPTTGWFDALRSLFYFLKDMALALFSSEAKAAFISTAPGFFVGKPLLPLLLCLASMVYALLTLLQLLEDMSSEKRQPKLLFWVSLLTLLAIGYLICWKVPVLIFSFFTVAQSVSAILSSLLGIYTAAILAYFPLVFLLGRFYKQPGQYR